MAGESSRMSSAAAFSMFPDMKSCCDCFFISAIISVCYCMPLGCTFSLHYGGQMGLIIELIYRKGFLTSGQK